MKFSEKTAFRTRFQTKITLT